MPRVLVAYASRHGGTRGIAERIGEVLRTEGLEAVVASTDATHDVGMADAFVIGSGVYMGSWLKEATDFIALHEGLFATRPVWLFSSGPLLGSQGKDAAGLLADALGPTDGPGSGGRKKIAELSGLIHPRDHRAFLGAYDPKDPPKVMVERIVRMMPAAKKSMPAGDFRDWDAVEAWAREIAAALRAPVGAR